MDKHILNARGGESRYSAPTIEILTVQVEQGFAVSPVSDDYGDYNDPGKKPGDDIYGDF